MSTSTAERTVFVIAPNKKSYDEHLRYRMTQGVTYVHVDKPELMPERIDYKKVSLELAMGWRDDQLCQTLYELAKTKMWDGP